MKGHGHILCFVLALALWLGRAVAADPANSDTPASETLSALEVPALVTEIERGTPGAVAEAIKRIPGLDAGGENFSVNPQVRVFMAACGAASEPELESLREILVLQLGSNPLSFYSLSAYTQARLRLLVAKAKVDGLKIPLGPITAPVPASLVPEPDLSQAWTAWHQAVDSFSAMVDQANAANRDEKTVLKATMDETLRNVLTEPKPELVRELALHMQNEPMLVTQRDLTLFPGSHALLLETMPGKLTPETAGAVLKLTRGRLSFDAGGKPDATRETLNDLLALEGLNWEDVFAGAMLQDGVVAGVAGVGVLRRLQVVLDDMSSWQALAARGSPHGIRLGLAIIRKTKLDVVRSMDFIGTALRTTPPESSSRSSSGVTISGSNTVRPRPLPYRSAALPAEVQAEVLGALNEFLALEHTPAELQLSLRLVPRELYAAAAEPLRKLMHYPSHPIAKQARSMLVMAKLEEESAEITPPPAPLRVRVMVDEAPLATTRVRVGTSYNGTSLSTDAGGWLSIPLDQELDLTKMRSVRIASELSTISGSANEWPGPWIDLTVPVDGKVAEDHTVTAITSSLEVDLDPTSKFHPTKPAHIILTRNLDALPFRNQDRVEVSTLDSVTFQHLQRGTYSFEVLAEGAAIYRSKPVALSSAGSIRLARLEPGRNVRVKFETTDSILHIGRARLFREGKPFEVRPNDGYTGWDGLPLGKYQLRLDPWPNAPQGVIFTQGVPKNGYEGLTQDFEISADSPSDVDLGKLPLKAKE